MKVLITGGAGFIGSHTARRLLERGHAVTVLDNFLPQVHGPDRDASPTWRAIREDVALEAGDVRDTTLLSRVVPEHDAVLHLAAETGTGQSMYAVTRYTDVNLMGTAALLQSLVDDRGRVSRLVVASSRSVYGEGLYACADHGEHAPVARDAAALAAGRFDPACPDCGRPLTPIATRENAPLRPASVYAVTKLAQEQMVLAVAAALGIGAVALRYQNVYGAGQSLSNPYTGILSIFSREMLAARDIEIFEDGEESRDFVHVVDVARANVAALEAAADGAVLNVGSGRRTSVLEVARRLADNYGYRGRTSISGRFRAGDIRHNCADVSSLERVLGVRPETSLEKGLAEFCTWVRAELRDADGGGYVAALDELRGRGLLKGGAASTGD
jgi:dTDP-L-rhamnose 4-epimerase